MNVADLQRLATSKSMLRGSHGDWMTKQGIEHEVAGFLLHCSTALVLRHLNNGVERVDAIEMAGAEMFMIGWDAAIEFGRQTHVGDG